MAKILIIEDNIALASMIKDCLVNRRHVVEIAATGEEARDQLFVSNFDLIVLDLILPDSEGLDLCKEYRSKGGKSAILMLTARNQVINKEDGFEAGADDYLTKPFDMQELLARVKALLRRPPTYCPQVLSIRDLRLDSSSHRVMRGKEEVHLHPREYALLEFFMLHPDQTFSAEALIQRIWPSESDATGNTLAAAIKRLRQKLRDQEEQSRRQTIRGYGYRLNSQLSSGQTKPK